MRQLHNVLLTTACCGLLWLATGCQTEENIEAPNPNQNNQAQTIDTEAVPATKPSVAEPVVVITPEPVVVPPVVGPVFVPGGGGGGSGGSSQPADTGNPDNDADGESETICNDGIDDDNDGLFDCEDSDCFAKSCNDGSACTQNDLCGVDGCNGTPVNCEKIIGNVCSVDVCVPVAEGNDFDFRCESTFDESNDDLGDCVPADNCSDRDEFGECPANAIIDACIIGRCVTVDNGDDTPTFECQASNLIDYNTDDFPNGCNDENSCTADGCIDGECVFSALDDVPCNDGNSCTNLDTCDQGTCVGSDVPNICESNDDCQQGFFCTSIAGNCEFSVPLSGNNNAKYPGDRCFNDGDCDENEICVGELLGGCTCDNNPCSDDICSDGECITNSVESECDDQNPCTSSDVCNSELECVGIPLSNGTGCEDDSPCTREDSCQNGECVGGLDPDSNFCSDTICSICSCTLDTTCDCVNFDGPSNDDCSLNLLTDVGLDLDIVADLTELGMPLECDIGLTECLDGEIGLCTLTDAFVNSCNAAALNARCDTSIFTSSAENILLATLICLDLQLDL